MLGVASTLSFKGADRVLKLVKHRLCMTELRIGELQCHSLVAAMHNVLCSPADVHVNDLRLVAAAYIELPRENILLRR